MKLGLTFNAKEVFAAFRQMKADARRENARILKRAVMETVERDAKMLYGQGHPGTPVDTNRLRKSIHTEITKQTLEIVEVMTGTNVNYAYFVHQGHITRGGGRFIPGRPFLFGPLEHLFPTLNKRYGELMMKAVQK